MLLVLLPALGTTPVGWWRGGVWEEVLLLLLLGVRSILQPKGGYLRTAAQQPAWGAAWVTPGTAAATAGPFAEAWRPVQRGEVLHVAVW